MIENMGEKRAELLKVIPAIDLLECRSPFPAFPVRVKKYTWNGDWRLEYESKTIVCWKPDVYR